MSNIKKITGDHIVNAVLALMVAVCMVSILHAEASAEKENSVEQEKLTQIQSECEQLQTECDKADIEIAKLNAQIETLKAENEELLEQNERLQTVTEQTAYIKAVIAAEARGDETQCMAVAQTILDRATDWNMTAYEVVTSPHQFANPYYGKDGRENVDRAYKRVFVNGERVFKDKIYWFHNTTVTPYWSSIRSVAGRIDNQIYYTV